MQDGQLLAAAQEERFSRIKNDRAFPHQAFRYCLEHAGLTITDVDCIAYYEDPELKLGRQIWMGLRDNLSDGRRESIVNRVLSPSPQDVIRNTIGYEGPIEIVDHHLSHAASAYYFSGFDESAILTVDAVGDWPTTTFNSGVGSEITRLDQVDFPDSLGLFYSAITAYLGFEVNEGEYKVMGLAPYGEPKYAREIYRMIQVLPGAQFRLDLKYFAFLNEDLMYTEELCSLLGSPPRRTESEISKFHLDVARSVQFVLEEVLLDKVRFLYEGAPSENLCMAGGVALNVVANTRCLKQGPFKRLFVQPAAGDAGGSVGAASVAHLRLCRAAPSRKRLEHVYLGPANSSEEIYRILQSSSAKFQDFRGKEEDLLRSTAEALSKGEVVGWCQGRMEFGPRALGARSILADPRGPQMRDRINKIVKMRESFRPFAPAVLESEAQKHFDLDHGSPFMLETCRVTSPIDLPAITHVDGSARVQTVSAETNPRFAMLLEAFWRRTGCPILLNTSFNMRGEPIVCSAIDVLMCFARSQIDALVVEDFILRRSDIPASWELAASRTARNQQDVLNEPDHSVYTFL